jgi:hypothetical protein
MIPIVKPNMLARLLPLLVLCVMSAQALGQAKDNRLGLSRDQILAMGDDKWFDYYAKAKGESPKELTAACRTYADALHERNEERLLKLPNRDRVERWYANVKEYGDAMFKIQSRNGGTIWNPIEAAQGVDIEEFLDHLENLEVKPDSTATPDLDACSKRVLAHHDEISSRLDTIPIQPLTGIGRIKVEQFNIRGRKCLKALTPELLKVGGQEAYLVFVTCSKLSDPDALFLTPDGSVVIAACN